MHRKFIALVVSTAIVITGASAIPARADTNDMAKVLIGIATIAIIGSALNNARKPAPVTSRYYRRPPIAPIPRPLPRRVSRYVLPGKCQVRANTRNGPRTLFESRCVSGNYAYARSLPRACLIQFWGDRRDRTSVGYTKHCLSRYGYRTAAR